MKLTAIPLAGLTIEDEASFGHVGLYRDLKQILMDDAFQFRVPDADADRGWGRVLFMNLTFFGAADFSDVLQGEHIAADVVAHVAWHHLARAATGAPGASASADAMLFGESIASAFDLYLVGRLLGNAPRSAFLETQIPAMLEVATEAGMSEPAFEALLENISADPERAFEDLRSLLFDAATTLAATAALDEAAERLGRFDRHRFAPLLHHFELSNWILGARAQGSDALAPDAGVRAIDAELRAAPVSLDWLEARWIRPRLAGRRPSSP